jgi:anti-sigma factor RsiW
MRDDEEELSDYCDGRMESEEKAAFERRLADEPALERRLRLLRAMKAALKATAPAMPADLKAALKREARARAEKPRTSWLDAWRASLRSGLGCGLGAAFAVAALAFAARLALPRHHAARPAGSWSDAAASEGLKGLWSDDDGRDGDEG